MIDDKIEMVLNGQSYNARLDMRAIAETQYHFEKLDDFRKVPEIFKGVFDGNVSIINEIIIQSILSCHSQLTRENIFSNMKLLELNNIIDYSIQLLTISLPKNEDKKKETKE